MKYVLFSLVLLFSLAGSAQVSFTFEVDMTNEVISPNGVHVVGNFQNPDDAGVMENPDLTQWDPSAHTMSDDDMDGVYSITLMMVPALYDFKYVNGNTMGDAELVPEACMADLSGNSNRQVYVNDVTNSYSVCFAHCALCGHKSARIRIDMSQVDLDADGVFAEVGEDINPAGMHVAGDFQNPTGTSGDWDPSANRLYDWDGDNVYEGQMDIGLMNQIMYKAINGDMFSSPFEVISGDCSSGSNSRLNDTPEIDNVLPIYCWNSCYSCATIFGCMNNDACNYDPQATVDNGSCIITGSSCDDGVIGTINDVYNSNCDCVGIIPQDNCAFEIFISEYVEGLYNNRAVELFNPTDLPVVLDGVYSFGRYRDGAMTPMMMPITGTIAPHDVMVFALDKRDPEGTGTELPIMPELIAVADTFVNPILDLPNSPFYFNGDDAFVLMREGNIIIDLVGALDIDPGEGWWQPGDPLMIPWTRDRTMVRKSSISVGVFASPAVFDPSLEWDTLSVNDFSHLGWHAFDCAQLVYGCTDTSACNYLPDVISNASLCIYHGCLDPTACNYAPSSCGGGDCYYSHCDDPTACNYFPDGCGENICVYPGCDDPSACNYVEGICPGGTCTYPGCIDPFACNYDASACEGGICIYPGCDDPSACNYVPDACGDDTCIYPGCDDPEACNYDAMACGGGSCIYPDTEGDTDCSGGVDEMDIIVFLDFIGCTEGCDIYDMDGDGVVGVSDLYILMAMLGL